MSELLNHSVRRAGDVEPEEAPTGTCRVLIVDRSEESREVFCTALKRRGLQTLVADRVSDGLALTRAYHPEVIVVDLEEMEGDSQDTCAAFQRESSEYQGNLLVLGVARRSAPEIADEQFIAKPYHYGPLIRKIETMCRPTF